MAKKSKSRSKKIDLPELPNTDEVKGGAGAMLSYEANISPVNLNEPVGPMAPMPVITAPSPKRDPINP